MSFEAGKDLPALNAALTEIDRLREALDAALQIKDEGKAKRLLSDIIETASIVDQMKAKDDQS